METPEEKEARIFLESWPCVDANDQNSVGEFHQEMENAPCCRRGCYPRCVKQIRKLLRVHLEVLRRG